MMRRRVKTDKVQNGVISHTEVKEQPPEFVHRESLLTVLMKESLHIRAIYHIFIVILLVLLCDTVIYDLVERGKINIGLSTIRHGFGDIKRAVRLWMFDLIVALAFYPGLTLYAAVGKRIANTQVARWTWTAIGVMCLVVMETALIAVPVWDLASKHLALASSVTVTCEMFRFTMKIHAAAVACAPRCYDDPTSLPSFSHYLYFLFAPTLIYKDVYPRELRNSLIQVVIQWMKLGLFYFLFHITLNLKNPIMVTTCTTSKHLKGFCKEVHKTKKIRWILVLFYFIEVGAIILYNSFLWERFILPLWSDYGKEPQVEAGSVVRGMFSCVLPGVISFLCGFYCLLHAWHNAFAEMLKFGDRLFYEDWWTTSQFSKYYRAWNRVVHSWLRNHIYRPIAPYAGRPLTTLLVFLVSAVAHEVILSLSFGFFYPVLLTEFGVLGLLLLPLTAKSGLRFPNAFNLFMWLAFFIGNGLLWSLYAMEYFARKNCPPSENDSFFIPKSWSCPEIVLKPNWTFENPFELI